MLALLAKKILKHRLSLFKYLLIAPIILSFCYLILLRYTHLALIRATLRYKITSNANHIFNETSSDYLIRPRVLCACRKDKIVRIRKVVHVTDSLDDEDDCHYEFTLVTADSDKNTTQTALNTHLFNLTRAEYDTWNTTCDLYSVLRRGKSQRVVSFSLYGRNEQFYKNLKRLVRQVKQVYPGWVIRVHYDSTVNESIVCELQCATDEHGLMYDNVDFCDAERLPVRLSEPNEFYNASVMHKMMWRFVPVNDRFVDVVIFRDTDSLIINVGQLGNLNKNPEKPNKK
jgi:hypothetical protein